MAEHSEASVDMAAHEQAYNAFVRLTVLSVALAISVVIMLAVGHFGSWGLASLGVFLGIIGFVAGMLMNGSPVPIAATTAFILLLKLLVG